MLNVKTILKLMGSTWAIDARFVADHVSTILAVVASGKFDVAMLGNLQIAAEEVKPFSLSFTADDNTPLVNEFADAPEGSLAVIPISGPLMKEGSMGMAALGKIFQQAAANPNIAAIMGLVDSPGGSVDGTETFGKIVNGISKPVGFFGDGLIASAAYWIASYGDVILASGKTTEIGSIGVMINASNLFPILEKHGAQKIIARAEQSSDKGESYFQLLAGNPKLIQEEMLNPIADLFINTVKENRGAKLNTAETLTGKIFLAEKALELGLIDGIATFEEAAANILALAGTESEDSESAQNDTKHMKFKAAHAVLTAALAGTLPAAEELTAAKAELDAVSGDAEVFTKAEFDAEKTALATAQENLKKAEARVKVLEEKPADEGTKGAAAPDKIITGSEKKSINPKAAHNQAADAYFLINE